MPSRSYTKHHLTFPSHFKLTEPAALYLTHASRHFAVSLIGIFLPIFIFKLPHKFALLADPLINNLGWVLLYFCIRSLVMSLATFLFSRFIFLRLQLKKSILLSAFLVSLKLLLLLFIERQLSHGLTIFAWGLILAGLLDGLGVLFYWLPYHILFARKADTGDEKFGRETSIRFLVVKLAGVTAPFMGGLIISQFGYDPLLISSILLIFVSTFPALISLDEQPHQEHSPLRVVKKYLLNRKFRQVTLAFVGSGVEAALYAALWPILIYLVLQNFAEIGALTSLSILISTIGVLWVGKLTDQKGARPILKLGVFFNTLFYLPRIFLNSAPLVYALDIFDRLNGIFYGLPFMSVTYEKAKKQGISDFIIYRELAIHLPMAITAGLSIFLISFLPRWQWLFLLAAIGSAMTYLITKDSPS